MPKSFPLFGLALLLSACSHRAPDAAPKPEQFIDLPLSTTALAGQTIAVIPLTLLAADSGTVSDPSLVDHERALRWVDSLLGRALTERAPEVVWKLAPELRKIARRAVGIAPDPDRMAQGMMRDERLRFVPDPFRSALRNLTAIAGGRFALVPAAVVFYRDPKGIDVAEVLLVLVDSREASVLWRTRAVGRGPTAEAALGTAIDHVLPLLEGR
ncbi:MAG: hypothetical protein ACHQXA_10265 [Gemmatimonadales bacterium]